MKKLKLDLDGVLYEGDVNEVVTAPVPPPPVVRTYTVVAGDDLIKIGRKVNLDWKMIASLNNIVAPYIIFPKQVLILPEAMPVPTPIEQPKYVMLNAINWRPEGLSNLPYADTSEITYFVIEVDNRGNLLFINSSQEEEFIKNVLASGKKVTLSIGGGSQDTNDISSAVINYGSAFAQRLAGYIHMAGYSGVWLDIENTSIPPDAINAFISILRYQLDTFSVGLSIGIYVQPYQLNTVWSNLGDIADRFSRLSAMIYDAGPFNFDTFKRQTLEWLPRIGNNRSKLLIGAAVNYPIQDGGLTPEQYAQVLDFVNEEKLGGAALWNNALFSEPWRVIQRQKFPKLY